MPSTCTHTPPYSTDATVREECSRLESLVPCASNSHCQWIKEPVLIKTNTSCANEDSVLKVQYADYGKETETVTTCMFKCQFDPKCVWFMYRPEDKACLLRGSGCEQTATEAPGVDSYRTADWVAPAKSKGCTTSEQGGRVPNAQSDCAAKDRFSCTQQAMVEECGWKEVRHLPAVNVIDSRGSLWF